MAYLIRKLRHKTTIKTSVKKEIFELSSNYNFMDEEISQDHQYFLISNPWRENPIGCELPDSNTKAENKCNFIEKQKGEEINFSTFNSSNKSFEAIKKLCGSSLSTISEESSLKQSFTKNSPCQNNYQFLRSFVNELHYRTSLTSEILNIFRPSSSYGLFRRGIAIRLAGKLTSSSDFQMKKVYLIKRLRLQIESRIGKEFHKKINDKPQIMFKHNQRKSLDRSKSSPLSTANKHSRHVNHFRSSLVSREKVHKFTYKNDNRENKKEFLIIINSSIDSVYF